VGIAVVKAPQRLNDDPIDQLKGPHVHRDVDVRQTVEGPVVHPSDRPHEGVLLPFSANAVDDLIALLPPPDELDDQFGRILQVRRKQGDDGVAGRAHQAVEGGSQDAEVPRVEDHLDLRRLRGEPSEDRDGVVGRNVVAKDVLVVVVGQVSLEDLLDRVIAVFDVHLFVVDWRNDADEFPARRFRDEGHLRILFNRASTRPTGSPA